MLQMISGFIARNKKSQKTHRKNILNLKFKLDFLFQHKDVLFNFKLVL